MPVSMHGLDLSGIKWEKLPKAPKDRVDFKANKSDLPSPYYMSDIKPFVSPVYDCGATDSQPQVISSRKHLRDHERAYDMVQVGDDLCGKIVEKEDKRKADLAKEGEGVTIEWVA